LYQKKKYFIFQKEKIYKIKQTLKHKKDLQRTKNRKLKKKLFIPFPPNQLDTEAGARNKKVTKKITIA